MPQMEYADDKMRIWSVEHSPTTRDLHVETEGKHPATGEPVWREIDGADLSSLLREQLTLPISSSDWKIWKLRPHERGVPPFAGVYTYGVVLHAVNARGVPFWQISCYLVGPLHPPQISIEVWEAPAASLGVDQDAQKELLLAVLLGIDPWKQS